MRYPLYVAELMILLASAFVLLPANLDSAVKTPPDRLYVFAMVLSSATSSAAAVVFAALNAPIAVSPPDAYLKILSPFDVL